MQVAPPKLLTEGNYKNADTRSFSAYSVCFNLYWYRFRFSQEIFNAVSKENHAVIHDKRYEKWLIFSVLLNLWYSLFLTKACYF